VRELPPELAAAIRRVAAQLGLEEKELVEHAMRLRAPDRRGVR